MGVVIITAEDWDGDLPRPMPDTLVVANQGAVIVSVRHASESDEMEGDFVKQAQVGVVVRRLDARPIGDARHRQVFRSVISVPTGRVRIGDADHEYVLAAHRDATTVVVLVDAHLPHDDLSPEAVRIDLLPG